MEIEEFIEQWIDGQCRKFAADIEEMEAIVSYLKAYPRKADEVETTLQDAVKNSQTNPVRCRCGDWTYGNYDSCGGPSGCYNCPA